MEKPAIEGGEPIRKSKIYHAHQYIDEADIQAVVNVMKGDCLTCGPKITELEQKLCNMTGAKYAVVCSSGTAALHIACLAAGVGEGDEVITTPITFAASANCALYCGAHPVFADINPETYNIAPDCVAKCVTERSKAVVAVDFTGQSVELDSLMKLCRDKNLVLIEDGAHVIGTKYKGRPNGSIADMTTLSFHPVKTVTGGEGGAVLTNDRNYYRQLLLYRTHGITREEELFEHPSDGSWYYEQLVLGYNYRMTDMQAALIISQLRLSIDRRKFFDALAAENVCCNVHYIPTYYFPYYERMGYKKGICPNAEKLYEEIISLPLYYAMTDEDVESVIAAVCKIATYYSK